MREPQTEPIRETEYTWKLVKSWGGLFATLQRVTAYLKRGEVTVQIRRIIRFGLVGVTGVLVNTTLLYLLTEIGGMNYVMAGVFATEVAIINNFSLNDRWTFGDVRPLNPWYRRALRYNSVALFGLFVSVVVLAGLTYLVGMHYLLANLFAIGAGTLSNYTGSYYFTWSTLSSRVSSVTLVALTLGWWRRLVDLLETGVGRLWP